MIINHEIAFNMLFMPSIKKRFNVQFLFLKIDLFGVHIIFQTEQKHLITTYQQIINNIFRQMMALVCIFQN